MRVNSCRWVISAFCLFSFSLSAWAVDVPGSASVRPVPSSAGTGLNGRYWKLPPKTIGEDPNALKLNGLPIINSQAPTATFTGTSINYTGDDLTPIATWLGADGGSLVGGAGDMDDGLISLTGFYAVPSAGTHRFRIASDDGSILKIGGVTVIDNDGSHGAPGNTPNGDATFAAAGLYPVEISYYNGDWVDPANPASHGGANIAWRVSATNAAPTDSSPLVGTGALYQVPEPTSLVLLVAGGLAGLSVCRRIRLAIRD
jgi:hypothetical protein